MLGRASFSYYNYNYDTDIEYVISNENNDLGMLNFSAWRDGNSFININFDSISSLMFYMNKEDIDVEKFKKCNYNKN